MERLENNFLHLVMLGGRAGKYEFGLVIASNKIEAKNIAKSKWLIGYKKSI